MTFKPDPKPPKIRRKAKPDETYRVLYRQLPCLLCDSPDTAYCHWPRHRGSGGRGITWEPDEGIPGCSRCHALIDGRLGVSAAIESERAAALERLAELAPAFWESIWREYQL